MKSYALEQLLPAVSEIPSKDVVRPKYKTIDAYLQQAENLILWCRPHKDALAGFGVTAEMVDELPVRLAACREAQAQWIAVSRNRSPKRRELVAIEARAEDMQRELKIWLEHLEIVEGKPRGFFLPNLNHRRLKGNSRKTKMLRYQLFAASARRYRDELRNAGADNDFVDRISEIGRQWVLANAAQKVDSLKSETVDTRNRAFTYLRQLELRIRRVGQFVFRDDPERLGGYCC